MSDATKAVFLSYAREDTDAARRIADALHGFGVEVWFDQSELRGGDAWDQKIRRQIKDCTLFLPIISQHTQARGEGYFRLEWKLAVERTHLMAEGMPFIAPVAVDDAHEADAIVPPEFMRVHWTRLPEGTPTPQFVEQIKRLLEAPRKSTATRKSESAGSQFPTAPTTPTAPVAAPPVSTVPAAAKSGLPLWAIGALVAVILALVGYVVLRPTAKEPTAPPRIAAEMKASVALPAAPVPVVNDKSIAVLPFENMSDDKENTAFFADGMHEDILTNLANIRELRVVSRTSVMEYRGTTKKIPQIARELGVAYILEGSVRRAGNRVRITGQLIRAANDEHLWAKNYDRELTTKDMFDIQAALSTEIAGALQAAISPETKKLLDRRPTENLAAYDLYLKSRASREAWNGGPTRVSLKGEGKFLQDAVDLDPNFAEAWAELAYVHVLYVIQNYDHTPARLAQADAAMARAVRLAPDTPEIIRLLGIYAYDGYRDYARATAQFEKVLQLQPNNSEAMLNLGSVLRRRGRWLESVSNERKATELDPGNANYATHLMSTLEAGWRWEEALTELRRFVAKRPDRRQTQSTLAQLAFQATGSTKEADDWLARLTPAQLESPRIIAARKYWANAKGDYVEWKRLDGRQPYFDEDDTPHWQQAIDAAMIIGAHGDMTGARARLGNFTLEVRSELELQPTNENLLRGLSIIEALLGQKEEALRDARKAVELMPETLDTLAGPVSGRNLAVVYAWTGDKDRAIAELARLIRVPRGVTSVHELRVDPAFAPLRGDPRFEALLNDPKNNEPLF